ncbi:MAG: DUF1294 domain-containing protein [Bacillota bacterium]|nr:DUF1294 domain-containing protein [Bacillota bacterium]
MLLYFLSYLVVLNLTGFITVGVDKRKARKREWRIRERTFFIISLIGGCPGVYSGLLFFRHKTRHWYFMIGIPAIFILQLILLFYFKNHIHW